MRQTKPKR